MTDPGRPISDDDLHGYVDGFLDADRRVIVEHYLANHSEAAARVAAWHAVGGALRDAAAWEAREPVPGSLNIARFAEKRGTGRWTPARIAAGIIVALAIGAGSGWVARGPGIPTGIDAVALEAAMAHRVFASDPMHPVEFGADQRAQLVNWATQRLGRPVTPPDLSKAGYRLVGGRLIATAEGPAFMFLYDDVQGGRVSLFIRPMQKRDMNAAMRPVRAPGAAGFAWAKDGLGVSLVASDPTATLHALANDVRGEV
ncbi:MAG TPA: anti-sigma factor [Acetobacteraceae bacterium]